MTGNRSVHHWGSQSTPATARTAAARGFLFRDRLRALKLAGILLTLAMTPVLDFTAADREALSPARLNERAPEKYRVVFETTKGEFTVEVARSYAPLGADRFYYLLKHGFYDGTAFFQGSSSLGVQFGVPGDPTIAKAWREQDLWIKDDPVQLSNKAGSFYLAMESGRDSRAARLVINLKNSSWKDHLLCAPLGFVVVGMDVVKKLYIGYGDDALKRAPSIHRLVSEGNSYLRKNFPKLDYVKQARLSSVSESQPVSPPQSAASPP